MDPTQKLEDLLQQLRAKMDELPKKDDSAVSSFFDMLLKAKNGECIDDQPCNEVLSPCCGKALDQVFGSLPVEVICKECGNSYKLRELITKEIV